MKKPAALVMGILNITPDSFSDGGQFLNKDSALRWAEQMVREGADILDVGGESTRPGAKPVALQEEMDRVLPLIEALSQSYPTVELSIDTSHYEVAKEALELGAGIINDVSGGSDVRLLALLLDQLDAKLILMHRKGTPETMQQNPEYPQGAVSEVKDFLVGRVRAFIEAGVGKERLWVDPGFGFGKTLNHNLDLLRHLKSFTGVGERLMVGTSRKAFLAGLLKDSTLAMSERLPGTIATNLWAYQNGATVFRVHEVGPMKKALQTWDAIIDGSF